MAHSPDQGHLYGPNGDCPFNPITPLTDTPATITGGSQRDVAARRHQHCRGHCLGLAGAVADGAVHEGDAYNTTTSKVMIVMTDGENYPLHRR